VDSAPPQPAELGPPFASAETSERPPRFVLDAPLTPGAEASIPAFEVLWKDADGELAGLEREEFAQTLRAVGAKYNYGLPPTTNASPAQVEAFYRALQLRDLALAQACALGRDAAWQQFLARFREPLTQAAVAITGSASLGRDLADSLYSELFGLTERTESAVRRSPPTPAAAR